MNKLLLLPSAQLVPPELQMEFGTIPAAMVPVNGRPAFRYIAESYLEDGFDILIAAYEQAVYLEEQARRVDQRYRVVDVGNTISLGGTVFTALESIRNWPEQLVINFADTYVADPLVGADVICYMEQEDVFRWTTFKTNALGEIICLDEKGTEKGNDVTSPVFVGVFSISRVERFAELLGGYLEQEGRVKLDPFYCALRDYFNELPQEEKAFQQVNDWRDFGHLDTYHKTRRSFFMNQRAFNSIVVDSDRGIVRKMSRKEKKFIDEIQWYLKLPKSVSYLAPRIFNYSLAYESPFVEMEFYGYPSLSDIYLFGNCDMGVWNLILASIERVMDEMSSFQFVPSNLTALRQAMEDMYVGKTLERLTKIASDPKFSVFQKDHLFINDVKCLGLPTAIDLIPELVEAMNIYECPGFSIIHGDLCLSNILFDRRHVLVRLVDPRGSFGDCDIYGDARYDLAKLAHSFEGDYDFLLNGLFDIKIENDHIHLGVHHNDQHQQIKQLFQRRMLNKCPDSYPAVKCIESLLFLSMTPLHDDRFISQQAFLTRGLQIFSSLVQQYLPGMR